MKTLKFIGLFIVGMELLGCQGPKQAPLYHIDQKAQSGRPFLQIGDQVLHEGYFGLLLENLPGFRERMGTPEGRREILDQVIEQELFLQESRKRKLLENNPRFDSQLWFQYRSLGAGASLHEALEEEARRVYREKGEAYFGQVELGDIVLLVDKSPAADPEARRRNLESRALALRGQLSPENFATLAGQWSEDEFGKGQGGRIGAIGYLDQRVATLGWRPLVDAAFELRPGEVSAPIWTREGLHLIMPLAPKKIPAYEEIAPLIRSQLLPEVKKRLLAKLKAEAPVQYLEPALAPPAATATPSPE